MVGELQIKITQFYGFFVYLKEKLESKMRTVMPKGGKAGSEKI